MPRQVLGPARRCDDSRGAPGRGREDTDRQRAAGGIQAGQDIVEDFALSDSVPGRTAAFVLFVAAALSDLWDGYLARKHGWITDVGKLLDPIADKLLIVCTFIPFYILSHSAEPLNRVPWWGTLPLWVLVVATQVILVFVSGWRSWDSGTKIPTFTPVSFETTFPVRPHSGTWPGPREGSTWCIRGILGRIPWGNPVR